MKRLLSAITIVFILGILAAVGFFGYTKYQAEELEKDKLQAQQKENDDSDSQSINESANNESQNNSQQQSTTEEYTSDEQQVTRNKVFDYAIAAVNEVGMLIYKNSKNQFIIMENGKLMQITNQVLEQIPS